MIFVLKNDLLSDLLLTVRKKCVQMFVFRAQTNKNCLLAPIRKLLQQNKTLGILVFSFNLLSITWEYNIFLSI